MSNRLSPSRALGSSGIKVPLIGYGTSPLGKEKSCSHEQAVRCLHHAIDCGITYLDTSPDYGSEKHVGAVMKTRRDEVFLATKVNRRSREGVLDEIKQSLKKLQTDHVDLIQVHAINAWADWEQTIAPDGALAGLEQARDEGLVKFIGITGHTRPDILGHALDEYAFDTVLVALGIIDRLVSSPETFLLPHAKRRGAGVVAMKVFGHGVVENRQSALNYSLSLPGVSHAIIGLDNEHQIDEIVKLATNYHPIEDSERDSLIDEVRPIVDKDASDGSDGKLFWLRDTAVMGWKQHDEPILVSY